jgi:UDP-N-acetyl-D-mannosaminuronate dehydrogenase
MKAIAVTPELLASVDCVVVLTDHTAFDYAAVVANASVIVDTRNAIKDRQSHVFTLGAPNRAHAEVWQPPVVADEVAVA